MRLVTFYRKDGVLCPGIVVGDKVIDLLASDAGLPDSIAQIFSDNLLDKVAEVARSPNAIQVLNPRLAAPIPNPGKIICIGLNYQDHAVESGMTIPDEPVVFSKFATSVIGPNDPIVLPSVSQEVDYEAELVVVMGREASHVGREEAMSYVGGFTIGNDVSARDWQLKKPGGQWILGKSFSTFAPIGPSIVTRDEVNDPHEMPIEFRLNGEQLQKSSTRQLIFRIDFLISYLSQVCVLKPGDLIFTGTPPGVGFARKPPIFLRPGDLCEVEIAGIGILSNSCVSQDNA